MVNWIEPQTSKRQVNKAGDRIRCGKHTPGDVRIVENWRASHAYVLNTFQSNLRQRSLGKKITVAQRLKRQRTIFDKLKREPGMNLARMHDIAGFRLIFENEEELIAFRKDFHTSRMKHKRTNAKDDRYNYITNPKASGYRGIHDVFEYDVSSKTGVTWNGLFIEVQYRTKFQHAWATAVEVADFTTSSRIKFGESSEDYAAFFQYASEIIARAFEEKKSCLSGLSNREIVTKFRWLDRRLNLMRRFKNLASFSQIEKVRKHVKKNTILRFAVDAEGTAVKLTIERGFKSVKEALARYEELEKDTDELTDVVLVQADNPESIREAFKNYFADTEAFTQYITQGLKKLSK